MLSRLVYSLFFSLVFTGLIIAQEDTNKDEVSTDLIVVKDTTKVKRDPINILGPSKAAFYSAVLPGLGQAYNKKYWKIPVAYVLIGIPTYFYLKNDKDFDLYRDAYKRRLAGFAQGSFGDPFPNVSNDGLIRAQEELRRRKELSLLFAIGFYALNIVDANVDAHLLQFNVDEDLSFRPHMKYNQMEQSTDLGLTLNFKF